MDDSNGSSDSVEFPGTGNSPVINGHMETEPISDEDDGQPKLVIVEQPQQRGFRFRYECEGPSHGGLQGYSSERYRKTVPTVKVKNFSGPVRVIVNLVTDETVPKCHAHKLVGKNCQNGTCTVDVKAGTAQIAFPNLCIQHVTRRKASEVLEQRICEEMLLNKRISINNLSAKLQLTDEEKTNAKNQAEKQAKNMQLNVVRLCFQAFLLDNNSSPFSILPSVVSEPIYDSKAPGANALKICRMDKYSGCCTGNDEVFLLCEKVQKDDVQVRFVEQDVEGNILWQAYGHFGPFDVHRQFAIVFKTPEYHDITINKPVNVLVSLQRKSDGEYSDPKSFTYYPRSYDNEDIEGKRRKILPHYTDQRGNFGDMNSSFNGGDNSNGGSSSGMSNSGSNGMQNGGGTIPDFENLRTFPIVPELGCSVSGSARKILIPISRKSAMFKKMAGSLLENPADDLIAHPSNYMYEEIQKRSPPSSTSHMQFYGSGPTQQIIGSMSAAMTTNPMSVATTYSQGSLSMGSPENIVSSYGNESHSPQRALTSPQNTDHSQSMGYGSQNVVIGSVNVNLPVTQSTVRPTNQMTQMQTGLQMTSDNLVGHQSVHGSDLGHGSVNLEPDYLMFDTTVQQFQYYNPSVRMFDEYSPYVYGTCAYQARGSSSACDTDLQDVMTVLDMVDGAPPRESMDAFDEVDSSAADEMDFRTRGACLISDKKDFLTGHLPKSSKVSNLVKEKLVKNEEYVAMKPVVTKEPKITVNTSAQSEQPQKCETAVQTEMDSMMQLAMKTSQALQYYAASGDVRSILMVQRFLMAVQDTDGDLPLHTALINEKFEVFQNILDVMVTLPDAYARINAFNFHLQSPLHIAVITNQPKAVDLLIRAGADTTLVDRNGYTPAHLAVWYSHDACLTNLLKYVRPGVDPKHPFPELNTRCYDGFTPAHLAAQLENLTAMKLLVYGKTDVNIADGKSGRSPLQYSVEADDLSLAAYLILQASANVNAKRFDGNTALHIACGHNNVGMVALLMAGGADPTIENDDPLETDSEGDSSDDNEQLTSAVSEEVKDMQKEVLDEHNDKIDGTKNEGSDMEKETTPCKGLLPAHFASNNEKILRVLKGEPYSSLRDSPTDQRNDNNMTDKWNSMKTSTESGIDSLRGHSIGSDLNKLEYPIRMQLSELLDPIRTGCDWQALADKLGMQHLLQGDMGDNSPTRLLFTYFETNGGTISQLSQALTAIKRNDCVLLLRNLNKENEKDSILDSGVSESFRKSVSPIP